MLTSKRTKIVLLFIAFLCFACTVVFGQGPGFGEDVEDTPIDGGATIMLVAAAGYGAKKLAEKKK